MLTRSEQGMSFTNSQLLDAWQTFLGNKCACTDLPGAANAPEEIINEDEHFVGWDEFDECVNAICKGKTPGLAN